jgi:hypothetical protein
MASIAEILAAQEGETRPGATEEQVSAAEREIGLPFPEDLRAFLRWSNGWDGWLEGWPFNLDGTHELPAANDESFQKSFPGCLAVGGNGGLETYAVRRDPSGSSIVVAIDRNSASVADVWPIAATLTEAVDRLRTQPTGPWQLPGR